MNAAPEMLDMLLHAAGQRPAAGGGMGALLPLLQGLGGSGASGAVSLAALAPLLQMMGRPQPAPQPEPEAAAEADGPPPDDADPADEDGPREQSADPLPRGKARRHRFAPGLETSVPALLQLLTGLGALNQRPPQPPPEPPPEDFDPCSLCSDPCPRKNAAISFDQVQALAATFPGYA